MSGRVPRTGQQRNHSPYLKPTPPEPLSVNTVWGTSDHVFLQLPKRKRRTRHLTMPVLCNGVILSAMDTKERFFDPWVWPSSRPNGRGPWAWPTGRPMDRPMGRAQWPGRAWAGTGRAEPRAQDGKTIQNHSKSIAGISKILLSER